MAAGLPVVATAVGGIPEVVVDGETGFLVNKGDAAGLARHILDLLKNPELRAEMGTAARKQAEQHFSLDTRIQAIEQLYVQEQHQP